MSDYTDADAVIARIEHTAKLRSCACWAGPSSDGQILIRMVKRLRQAAQRAKTYGMEEGANELEQALYYDGKPEVVA